jgi:hypothetical protein
VVSSLLAGLVVVVGTMTLANRKGAMNEANPLRPRPNLVPHDTIPLFWDGEVQRDANLQPKSKPFFNKRAIIALTNS